jgi:hypothetical protein
VKTENITSDIYAASTGSRVCNCDESGDALTGGLKALAGKTIAVASAVVPTIALVGASFGVQSGGVVSAYDANSNFADKWEGQIYNKISVASLKIEKQEFVERGEVVGYTKDLMGDYSGAKIISVIDGKEVLIERSFSCLGWRPVLHDHVMIEGVERNGRKKIKIFKARKINLENDKGLKDLIMAL